MADTAVFHQTALERGGGLRVAEEISKILDAPLYIGIATENVLRRIPDNIEVRPLLTGLPAEILGKNIHFRRLYSIMKYRRSNIMSEFKTIILSGSLLQWYVPNPDQHVVVYRHSIKYPYVPEGFEPLRSAFEVFMWPYHQYPNKYLSNSDRTKRHLKNRLNINSEVVYPPIVTKDYQHIADGDFFLTVTRVTKGKCVDHLVESFRSIDERLVIAGDGDLRSKLEERSPDNVELLGYVSEEKKRELLGRCRCFINHSGAELFGIAAAEALASGKPILMAKGGYNHVQDGMNGFTYQHENLGPAIRKFQSDGVEWDRRRIKEFAEERYGIERFKNQIKSAVDPK